VSPDSDGFEGIVDASVDVVDPRLEQEKGITGSNDSKDLCPGNRYRCGLRVVSLLRCRQVNSVECRCTILCSRIDARP